MEFVLLPHEYSVETLRDRAVTPEGHPRHLVHADGVEDDELNGVERGRREHGEDEDAVVLLGGAGAGHEDGLGDEVAGVLPRDDVPRRRVDLQDLEISKLLVYRFPEDRDTDYRTNPLDEL